jgi:DNA replication protein DnaC
MSTEFDESLQRMIRSAQEAQARAEIFVKAQPQTVPCSAHPDVLLHISFEATRKASCDGKLIAGYEPCPRCAEAHAEKVIRERLHKRGVPDNLLHCTLSNWNPGNLDAQGYLSDVLRFAIEIRRGFLVLLGDIGSGKTHLAIGVMRYFTGGIFVKQATLLRMFRATYGNKNAADPVERCQNAGLLVLDEMGLSPGGRDEPPMLHEILDYRFGERKPTVITGNLPWEELASMLGARLADRLLESVFRVITLTGESHRAERNKKYFEAD